MGTMGSSVLEYPEDFFYVRLHVFYLLDYITHTSGKLPPYKRDFREHSGEKNAHI